MSLSPSPEWPVSFGSSEDFTWLILSADRTVVERAQNANKVLDCEGAIGKIDDLFPEAPRGIWHALVVGAPTKKISRKTRQGSAQEFELTIFPEKRTDHRVAVLRKLQPELTLGSVLMNAEGSLKDNSQFRALYVISGGLAHEINNPLSVLMGAVATLKDKFLAQVPPESRADLEKRIRTMEITCSRIHSVVNGLKNFVGTETLQSVPRSSKVEDILETIAGSATVAPSLRIDGAGMVLPGSIRETATALQLLLNSGPTNRAPAQVHVLQTGEWAQIQFTFDTTEEAAANRHRVVDAMFDLTTETRVVDSVGIAIATGIIEALKGHLSVERPSHEVLNLTVRLPLA